MTIPAELLATLTRSEILSRAAAAPEFDRFYPLGGDLLSFSTKGLSPDKGTMAISGILSYEEPDRVKELVVLDGLDLDGFKANPVCLFQHNRMAPVGLFRDPKTKAFTVNRQGKALRCVAHLVQSGPAAPLAEQVFGLAETGLLNGFSLGFVQNWKSIERVPDNPDSPYGGAVLKINQTKAFEGSLVFIPENDRTLVTEVVRKGLRDAGGNGFRPLLPQLASALTPWADPEADWVVSGWDQGNSSGKANGSGQSQEGKEMSSTPAESSGASRSGEVKEVVKEVRVEVVPPEVQTKALRSDWYDRTLSGPLGLPVGDYDGKPTHKALRAMHDTALFAALQASATLAETDGPAEADLKHFVHSQVAVATQIVERHKALYGDDPDWPTVSTEELAGVRLDGTEPEGKDELTRLKRWAAKSRGWKKGHAARCGVAAKALRDLAALAAAPTEEQKRLALEAAGGLEGLTNEKGLPVDVDDERDRQMTEFGERIKKLEEHIDKLQRELRRARAGIV